MTEYEGFIVGMAVVGAIVFAVSQLPIITWIVIDKIFGLD